MQTIFTALAVESESPCAVPEEMVRPLGGKLAPEVNLAAICRDTSGEALGRLLFDVFGRDISAFRCGPLRAGFPLSCLLVTSSNIQGGCWSTCLGAICVHSDGLQRFVQHRPMVKSACPTWCDEAANRLVGRDTRAFRCASVTFTSFHLLQELATLMRHAARHN